MIRLPIACLLLFALGCKTTVRYQYDGPSSVEHHNPDELHRNPTFSQIITVEGPHRLVFIGGQNSVDGSGLIQGQGDLAAQAEQVFGNLVTALHAGGARLEHVVKWTVYVVGGNPVLPVFQTFHRLAGEQPNPPTISVVYVSALAHPDFLVEVDAIAAVPAD